MTVTAEPATDIRAHITAAKMALADDAKPVKTALKVRPAPAPKMDLETWRQNRTHVKVAEPFHMTLPSLWTPPTLKSRKWQPPTRNGILFIDVFCGAGGSSIGLAMAGFTLLVGMNHWKRAIETHWANFQDSHHEIADVNCYDFRRLPFGAVFGWFSPICTEVSPAGGNATGKKIVQRLARLNPVDRADARHMLGEPAKAPDQRQYERTRATFFDVIRAVEFFRFEAFVVENVPDVVAVWELFPFWVMMVEALGYNLQFVSINSAHVGSEAEGVPYAPQWRDRLYIVCTRKGMRLPDVQPSPRAYCTHCRADVDGIQTWCEPAKRKQFLTGRYRRNPASSYGQYWYTCGRCRNRVEPYVLPAGAAVDWTNLGERIGSRKKELKPNTMRRIREGVHHLWGGVPTAPFYTKHYGGYAAGVRMSAPLASSPFGTLTTSDSHSIAGPMMTTVTGNTFTRGGYVRSWDTGSQPMPALTTDRTLGLTWPPQPFRVNSNHDDTRITPIGAQPFPAFSTKIGDGLVCPAAVVPSGGGWGEATTPVHGQPFTTRTANGKGFDSLLTAPGEPFFAQLRRNGEAIPAGREPLSSLCAGGRHHALIQRQPLILPYYSKDPATTADQPLGTVSTKDRFALIQEPNAPGYSSIDEIDIDDLWYRMIQPVESLAAQCFPVDRVGIGYEGEYEVTGGPTDQTMQAGNAVSANVAHWLGARIAVVMGAW